MRGSEKESTVLFNIGGCQYRVSKSLLSMHPDSMLTRSASDLWHSQKDDSEIYIDRNGLRFQFVLDYLRDGEVFLPISESKEAVLVELEYYNIDCKEESIHSSQGQAAGGTLLIIQNTIQKWRCADLAADCIEAAWDETQWRGDKKYLSLKPHRFKDVYKMKDKVVMGLVNEFLLSLGIKVSSIEFDIVNEACRVTLQLLH